MWEQYWLEKSVEMYLTKPIAQLTSRSWWVLSAQKLTSASRISISVVHLQSKRRACMFHMHSDSAHSSKTTMKWTASIFSFGNMTLFFCCDAETRKITTLLQFTPPPFPAKRDGIAIFAELGLRYHFALSFAPSAPILNHIERRLCVNSPVKLNGTIYLSL